MHKQRGDENWIGDLKLQRRGSSTNCKVDRQRRGSSMSIQEENIDDDGINVLMAVDQNITGKNSVIFFLNFRLIFEFGYLLFT